MKHIVRASLSPLVALLLVVLAGDAARASTGPKWSDEQLADFSAAIVTGRVASIASQWDAGTIYTYVTIDVDDVLKGAVAESRIVLKQAGGIVGEIGLDVSGQARFELGEEVLVFAEVRPRDRTLYTTALGQGKWTIETDRASGARVAVRHDYDLPAGETETDRRSFDALRSAVASRAQLDRRSPEGFDATPDEATGFGANPFAFLDSPARWMEMPVSVDIQSGGQPGIPGGGGPQFQNIFAQWNASANFVYSLRSISASSRCGNTYGASGIVWFVVNDPCAEISNSGGTLAVAFSWFTTAIATTVNGVQFRRLLEVVVTMNDSTTAQQFATNANCFQTVMLHEFGHALGLGHTTVAAAVMFPSVSFSGCSASPIPLHADDIAGAQAIYPSSGGGGGTPGTPTGVVATVSGSTLNIRWTAPTTGATPTSYTLRFYADAAATGTPVVPPVPVGNTTTVAIPIPPGTVGTFYVRVSAVNGTTEGTPSAAASFTIGSAPPPGCTAAPAPVTGLTGRVVAGVAMVNWTASATATVYIVQAGAARGGTEMFNAEVGNVTGVTAPVPPGFRAWVRVIARNPCGNATGVDVEIF